MLQGRGTPSLKPRDRANAACTAQLAVRTRGAAASLVPGRRRRRRPPRGAAERALDGNDSHTHIDGPREYERTSHKALSRAPERRAWSEAVADASRREA